MRAQGIKTEEHDLSLNYTHTHYGERRVEGGGEREKEMGKEERLRQRNTEQRQRGGKRGERAIER